MSIEELAKRFDQDRTQLRAVAYRLLGSLADAEDAVQSAWLKVSAADVGDVDNLTGWFTTVTARVCLDQLRARVRRAEVPLSDEEYGAHAGADEEAELAESVGLAMLVVLQALTPEQRVAFVLHDAFAVPFDEIGALLDRTPATAKKLASRARARVHGSPTGDQNLAAEHRRIAEAFLAASRDGDMAALIELLAPGVVRRVDSVLVPAGVATEVRGARAVAEETRVFAHRARLGAVALVDGDAGVVIAPRGRLLAVLVLRIDDGVIQEIDIVGEPNRLQDREIQLY